MNKKLLINIAFFSSIASVLLLLGLSQPEKLLIKENLNKTPAISDVSNTQMIERWADSLISTMTVEEKVGQLFIVSAYASKKRENETERVLKLIKDHHVGGILFFQGSPTQQVKLTNKFQLASRLPLWIAQDSEWGLGMRLDSTISYPKAMTLGAIKSDLYLYALGAEIARQCKVIGVNVNFAPVVDINNNPANPVIGKRSFGENKHNVTNKALALALGMEKNKVMAVAKHFPGHGDTNVDSHLSLPVIKHDKKRLYETELYPFKKFFQYGIGGVMVAHLHVPSLQQIDEENIPTSLSRSVVTDLLKDKLQFKGLVFTDALQMNASAQAYTQGKVELAAFLAGNDLLIQPTNLQAGIKAIVEALKKGVFKDQELDLRLRKILIKKRSLGLFNQGFVSEKDVVKKLVNNRSKSLKAELYEQALTLVKTDSTSLPIKNLSNKKVAYLSIGAKNDSTFIQYLSYYTPFSAFQLPKYPNRTQLDFIKNKLDTFDYVITTLFSNLNAAGKNKDYGISNSIVSLLKSIDQKENKLINIVFGSPYSLQRLDFSSNLICAYEHDSLMQKAVVQAVFGANSIQGNLPISASSTLQQGHGIFLESINRVGFAFPEQVSASSDVLSMIDLIAEEAIENEATPGCQVLVIKDGRVIWNKGYGYYTYEKEKEVTKNTIYDLASLTKVLSTLQVVMKLYEEKKLNLEDPLRKYLSETDSTNKGNLLIKDILMHEAGLISFYPFWVKTSEDGEPLPGYLSDRQDSTFSIQIAEDLYTTKQLQDSVWNWVLQTDLRKKKRKDGTYSYRYSDLGFMILQKVVERITSNTLDELADSLFYQPMGLRNVVFRPLEKHKREKIPPTEMDVSFRKSLLRGYVHDPNAALIGGVSGHAGLFGNALDIGTLLSMNLQKGNYAGKNFLNKETVSYFIEKQNDNSRRGLGWDKPDLTDFDGPTSLLCSSNAFGHLGFTGTCAWVDPDYNLIYVFLSNRVYPTSYNRKLMEQNIRSRIQTVIYNSIGVYQKPYRVIVE